jgi:hypothetical protein
MAFENSEDLDLGPEVGDDLGDGGAEKPPEESNNRTFLLVAGVMGAVMILALIFIAIYFALGFLPKLQSTRQTQAAERAQQSTAIAESTRQGALAAEGVALTQTADFIASLPDTSTPTPKTGGGGANAATQDAQKVTSTSTPLMPTQGTSGNDGSGGGGGSPTSTMNSSTATVAALMTQVQLNKSQTAFPTSTALSQTGFADEVGIPMLVVLAAVLALVVFLARRLRTAQ